MTSEKELSKEFVRNKLATFRTFEKAVYRGCGNYQSALKPRGTFSSLLERKKSVEEAMRDELNSDNPESLFQLDGYFIKNDKNILMHTLEENIHLAANTFSDVPSKDVVIIYDDMALVQSTLNSLLNTKTFDDIAMMLLRTALRPPGAFGSMPEFNDLRLDIVMDRYEKFSIKDQEGQKRSYRKGLAALCALPTVISSPQQPLPADFGAFLELSSNQEQLATFLAQEWIKEVPNILKSNQVLVIGGVRAISVSQYMESGVTDMPKLKGDVEEADPQLILHMYNAVTVESRHHGLLVAADTIRSGNSYWILQHVTRM